MSFSYQVCLVLQRDLFLDGDREFGSISRFQRHKKRPSHGRKSHCKRSQRPPHSDSSSHQPA